MLEELAGLDNVRIVNEPTAAKPPAYGIGLDKNEKGIVAVLWPWRWYFWYFNLNIEDSIFEY